MARQPLAQINPKNQLPLDQPVKTRATELVEIDSVLWNFRQSIGHLQSALNETNEYNRKLQAEIERLSSIEADLVRQRQINEPLISEYLRIKQEEDGAQ